jgi:predicted nucleic acid-binding protein
MRGIQRVLLDSSVYGAAMEDEGSYPVETDRYWDTVYCKALLRMSKKLEIFGCPPVEEELREAPQPFREKLLVLYHIATPLKSVSKVSVLSALYTGAGIFPQDALIASFASAHKLDAFVTVNRRHLRRLDTIRKISAINRRLQLGPLRILLPGELLELLS